MIRRPFVVLIAALVLASCQSRREFDVVNASGVELRVHIPSVRSDGSAETRVVLIEPGKTWRFKRGAPMDRKGEVRLEAAGCDVVYKVMDAPWMQHLVSGRIELQIEPDLSLHHAGWRATEDAAVLEPVSRVCS
jgi:hypothetical protein